MESALGQLAHLFGLDPFEYLIVTIAGIMTWIWCTVVMDVPLTGRSIWFRWSALGVAGLAAVLFAYTANLLP